MSRRLLREHTFKLLFLCIFRKQEEMEEQFDLYLQDNALTEEDAAYVCQKVRHIQQNIESIDQRLEKICENWKLSRVGKVELAVLRLAVYEIGYEEDIPKNVSINEAVEIAKKYGGDHSGSFVNGVLAKI